MYIADIRLPQMIVSPWQCWLSHDGFHCAVLHMQASLTATKKMGLVQEMVSFATFTYKRVHQRQIMSSMRTVNSIQNRGLICVIWPFLIITKAARQHSTSCTHLSLCGMTVFVKNLLMNALKSKLYKPLPWSFLAKTSHTKSSLFT